MLVLQVGAWLVAACVVVIALHALRCDIGLHPSEGRRMRSLASLTPEERKRYPRATRGTALAIWECGACQKLIAVTDLRISTPTMKAMGRQVKGSRERSKVINLHVVRKEEAAS